MNWDRLQVLGIWILVSILAIALISDLPYLAIAVAILGGVAVGVAHLLAFKREARKQSREGPDANRISKRKD